MTSTNTSCFASLARARATSILLSRKAALAGSLALSLLAPVGAFADEAPAPDAELALHQQPATPGEIRLKLHGIEDLSIEKLPTDPESVRPEDGADEARKQAQTKYLAAKFRQKESTVREYVDLAWAEARRRERLEPELLIAIIQKESAFRPKVQSRYGAQGLMQVVRRWHRDKLHPSESLFDPEVNIRVGAEVLEEYLALAGGNMDTALRKYSGNARGYVNNIKKESLTLARLAEQAASKAVVAQG